MTCLEARAGVVGLVGPVGTPRLLAWAGPWYGDGSARRWRAIKWWRRRSRPGILRRRPTLRRAGPGDADMVAPLLDRRGDPIGVLAVRGLPYRAAGMMALRDLAVVSGWLANVFTQPRRSGAAETNDAAEHDRDEAPYLELSLFVRLRRSVPALVKGRHEPRRRSKSGGRRRPSGARPLGSARARGGHQSAGARPDRARRRALALLLAAAAVHLAAVVVVFSMGEGLGRARRVLTSVPGARAAALRRCGRVNRARHPAAGRADRAVPDDEVESPTLDAASLKDRGGALAV